MSWGDGLSPEESEEMACVIDVLKQCAAMGSAQAQMKLVDIYTFGHGIAENARSGFEMLTHAAEQGHPVGQLRLGHHYEKGGGWTDHSWGESFRWYTAAGGSRGGGVGGGGHKQTRDRVLTPRHATPPGSLPPHPPPAAQGCPDAQPALKRVGAILDEMCPLFHQRVVLKNHMKSLNGTCGTVVDYDRIGRWGAGV